MAEHNIASGVLSLLDEDDPELKGLALSKLLNIVDNFWAEIAESVRKIEVLYEDEKFAHRELAALICAKVYYHLNALDESLHFALGAGKLFDVNQKNDEFVDAIVSKSIDTYIKRRVQQYDQREIAMDSKLQDVVERMFERCFNEKEYKQALGIAVESRRLDLVQKAITLDIDQESVMLKYCLELAQNLVTSRDFRTSLLKTLVGIYQKQMQEERDYFGLVQCLLFLGDSEAVSSILQQLTSDSAAEKDLLIAYQLAFDLNESAPQSFLTSIMKQIPLTEEPSSVLKNLHQILQGQIATELYIDFLYRSNNTDMNILKNIKASFDRNSILHSATVTANAFMHAGTTVDQFLRDNLDWLKKASNWSKFSAIASLGVIHKGQVKDSKTILKPYLPASDSTSSASGSAIYSEGGALYALGLIHSSSAGETVVDYLLNYVKKEGTNPVVQHGACLGLGLAAMATGREDLKDFLTNVQVTDNAVAGEAAAIAIGMVMLGTANGTVVEEMLAYARETSHEKIIRGLAIGISLIMYGREEEADQIIESLVTDKDPILRYGGMYCIAMAYSGTGNNGAVRKLLHFAVSDVSDDVRRAAVINLGFLLFKTPKQMPRLVSLLAESYNPHVRYGAAMAVGIACAGTGLIEALELLEPLAKDPVDFVRQGALLSQALVLQQFNENASSNPQSSSTNNDLGQKVKDIKKKMESIWKEREEIMTKTGAIMSAGIINAGGRNVTVQLHKNGHNKMRNIVGLAMFTQYWFWYPYIHFLGLSFEPTALIGLNHELKMPKYSFKSNVRPSLFAYPQTLKVEEKKEVKSAPTAELSLSARAKAKERQRQKRKDADGMNIDSEPSTPVPSAVEPHASEEEQTKNSVKRSKKPIEPAFEILDNPARVLPAQAKYISFDVDSKYSPVKLAQQNTDIDTGIVLLQKINKDEPDVFVEMKNYKVTNPEEEEEAEMPDAFEWEEGLLE